MNISEHGGIFGGVYGKDATGTATANASGVVTVTGLSFTPTLISLRSTASATDYGFTAQYSEKTKLGASADINYGLNSSNTVISNAFSNISNGFTFLGGSSYANANITWRAEE